jgi:ribonucleoside-triphosphate reductase
MSGVSLVNCWMTTISKVEDFQFLMDHLMVGGGVGFSVERAVVHDLPKVKSVDYIKFMKELMMQTLLFLIQDRVGRLFLVRCLIVISIQDLLLLTARFLIRGFGAPLKTFGGTASGPEILIEGIADICKILDARVGKKIRSVDALDICNIIGKIVVAGSARRSAQIAIGDPDDFLYLACKELG